jgi:2-dehydropantoate 2-reductase
MPDLRILVLGAGGIGGYFGGRLAESGADVTFLVREGRRKSLVEDGLRIESPFGNATLSVKTVMSAHVEPVYEAVPERRRLWKDAYQHAGRTIIAC